MAMASLVKRLEALEQAGGSDGAMFVRWQGPGPYSVRREGKRLDQAEGESDESFMERVRATWPNRSGYYWMDRA